MKLIKKLLVLLLCVVSLSLSAQLENSDYYLIRNQSIEGEDSRRLIFKISSDTLYEFIDNSRIKYSFNKEEMIIEFPLSNEPCKCFFDGDSIEIQCKKNIYVGSKIDKNTVLEKEKFKNLLVDIDLPFHNIQDSVILSLPRTVTWNNSEIAYLSYHQKSLYASYDRNEQCMIQIDDFIISMCDIDNSCQIPGVFVDGNKEMFFNDRIEDQNSKDGFVFTLFIDKDVKIIDINIALYAIKKIDNLKSIYFAVKDFENSKLEIFYLNIPLTSELNEKYATFSNWMSATLADRFIEGERIMFINY